MNNNTKKGKEMEDLKITLYAEQGDLNLGIAFLFKEEATEENIIEKVRDNLLIPMIRILREPPNRLFVKGTNENKTYPPCFNY